jgi:hypothetical protein
MTIKISKGKTGYKATITISAGQRVAMIGYERASDAARAAGERIATLELTRIIR